MRAQVLKHLPGVEKDERKRSEKDASRGATAGGTVKKSRSVRVIEGKQVEEDDPIE